MEEKDRAAFDRMLHEDEKQQVRRQIAPLLAQMPKMKRIVRDQ